MPQVAIVVGGTRRVGRWVSEALLVSGHRVHALYGSDDDAARMFQEDMHGAGYELGVRRVDAADEAQAAAAIEAIAQAEGGVSVLVNSWGPSVFGPLSETSSAELELLFRGNVLSAHNAVRAALPYLKQAGKAAAAPPERGPLASSEAPAPPDNAGVVPTADRAGPVPTEELPLAGGRIISFIQAASETGRAFRDIAAYASAKAMLYSYSRSLARELAPAGVTVNCIALGVAGLMPDGVPPVAADRIPSGRHVNQEDVAAAIWYLTSPPASQVTGTVLDLAGGFGL